MTKTLEVAGHIAALPPLAAPLAKESLRTGLDIPNLADASLIDLYRFAMLELTEDKAEGHRAVARAAQPDLPRPLTAASRSPPAAGRAQSRCLEGGSAFQRALGTRSCSRKRVQRNGVRSKSPALPCRTTSESRSPMNGECLKPWPLQPKSA